MGKQPLLIGRKPEKIGFFLVPLNRRAERLATYAVLADRRFAFVEIGLLAYRIPAGIAVEINIAIVGHALPDRLAGLFVARLGGADEIVVRAAERRDHGAKNIRVAVGQRLRRNAFLFGRLLHLQPVLVGTGQEKHVLAVEPVKTRQRVGGDHRIGVADMRLAVRVEDRRCQVEIVLGHGKFLSERCDGGGIAHCGCHGHPAIGRAAGRRTDQPASAACMARISPATCWRLSRL